MTLMVITQDVEVVETNGLDRCFCEVSVTYRFNFQSSGIIFALFEMAHHIILTKL